MMRTHIARIEAYVDPLMAAEPHYCASSLAD